jgi:polyhydroxybutyrate depolymerase
VPSVGKRERVLQDTRFSRLLACAVTGILLLPVAASAEPCGGQTACRLEGGNYRIEMPGSGRAKAVYVYFHGFKSSAQLQMQQRYLIDTTLAHHLAFVAVDGIAGSWSYPNSFATRRDEQRFIGEVFENLEHRFGFSSERTIIGGFSIGASMAWYTACQQGGRTSAMVTFSGVFWDPLPEPADCVADIPQMIHFHGMADTTFPLAGRAIGNGRHQGDTLKSIAVLRDRAKCDLADFDYVKVGSVDCGGILSCARGASVICLHTGGHEARADMLNAALTAIGYPK